MWSRVAIALSVCLAKIKNSFYLLTSSRWSTVRWYTNSRIRSYLTDITKNDERLVFMWYIKHGDKCVIRIAEHRVVSWNNEVQPSRCLDTFWNTPLNIWYSFLSWSLNTETKNDLKKLRWFPLNIRAIKAKIKLSKKTNDMVTF